MRILRLTLLLVALCAPAWAQSDDEIQRAAGFAEEAIHHHQRGAHLKAASLFLRAFEISGVSIQLRNAARAYDLAGDRRALFAWKRYRSLAVSQDEWMEADERIEALQGAVENARSSARPPVSPPPPPRLDAPSASSPPPRVSASPPPRVSVAAPDPPPGVFETVGPYALMAVGTAALATSAALWITQSSDLARLDAQLAMTDEDGRVVGIDGRHFEAELASVNRRRIASGILLGAALVSAAGGLLWLLLGPDGPAAPTASIFTPGRAMVAFDLSP